MSSFSANNDSQVQAFPHKFSASYQKRKQALIAEYAKEHSRLRTRKPLRWQMAIIAAAVCLLVPVGAFALSSNAEFFNAIFGNTGKENVSQHIMQEDEFGTIVAPSREYVTVDANQAEKLLAGSIASDPVTIQHGGHTLTIQNMVRSQNAMVMSYTLERPEGITALWWNHDTNADKGASATENTPLHWLVMQGGDPMYGGVPADEMIYVDPVRSSDTLLYCYSYMLFMRDIPEGETLELYVEWADNGSICEAREAGTLQKEMIELPAVKVVETTAFASTHPRGGSIAVSPLSIEITAPEIAYEDNSYMCDVIDAVTVNFDDGASYIVSSDSNHINNAMVSLGYGDTGEKLGLAFNRLVDPASIASITVTTEAGDVFTYKMAQA